MSMIDVGCTTEAGELFIDGETMHRLAFSVMDVTALWLGPVQRGSNLLIPGRPGRIPFMRRPDETVHSLRMLLDGRYDVDGNRVDNEDQGLLETMFWLRSNVSDPTMLGDGTRLITLIQPDGSGSLTGRGHLALTIGDRAGPLWRAVLEVTLPDGSLLAVD